MSVPVLAPEEGECIDSPSGIYCWDSRGEYIDSLLRSIVGMQLYLAGNMRPDIVYDREDPIPVKSTTRYVITSAGWPLTRKIKLQSLVAVYIKEARASCWLVIELFIVDHQM